MVPSYDEPKTMFNPLVLNNWLFEVSRSPGGLRKLREACKVNVHVSWHFRLHSAELRPTAAAAWGKICVPCTVCFRYTSVPCNSFCLVVSR